MGGLYLVLVGLTLFRQPAMALEPELAAITAGVDLSDPRASWADTVAARQLGAIELILDPGRGMALIDAARWASLLLVFAASLLIFLIVRRLEFRSVMAAAATAGCAIAGGLIQLYAGLNTGPVALFWLAIAAVFALSAVRYARAAALAAAALGVISMPVAAVGLLVFAGHLVAVSAMAPRLSVGARRWSVAGLLACALTVAVLATGGRQLAQSPSAVGLELALPIIACSAVVIGLAWRRLDWLRPVCTAAAALLACGLVPGTGLAAVATLVVPLIIVLGLGALDTVRGELPGPAVLAVVTLLGLIAAAPAVGLQSGWRSPTAAGSLSGWIATQLDAGRVVYTDDLTGAQLVRDGFPAGRLRSISDPVPPDAVIVLADHSSSPALELGTGSVPLARFVDGPGHAVAEVRLAGGVGLGEALRADQADRARFGSALASNPSVSWAPEAAASLRAGRVDPRLMTVLAGLAATHRLTVGDLPAVDVEPSDAPRRTAVITSYDGVATSDPGTTLALEHWLERQPAPYDPLVEAAAGQPVRVSFPAPTPLGLLSD